MVQKSGPTIFILLMSVTVAFSQFVVVPVSRKPQKKEAQSHSSRIQALTPMQLPFWDDFSFSNSKGYHADILWSWKKKNHPKMAAAWAIPMSAPYSN